MHPHTCENILTHPTLELHTCTCAHTEVTAWRQLCTNSLSYLSWSDPENVSTMGKSTSLHPPVKPGNFHLCLSPQINYFFWGFLWQKEIQVVFRSSLCNAVGHHVQLLSSRPIGLLRYPAEGSCPSPELQLWPAAQSLPIPPRHRAYVRGEGAR